MLSTLAQWRFLLAARRMRLIALIAATLMTALASGPSEPASTCQKHIELHGGKWWARELGKSEQWVVAHHKINVWRNQSPRKGQKLGEMRVGSRAVILQEATDDYKVQSPLDKSVGWVGKLQVARTLYQDVRTFKPCKP